MTIEVVGSTGPHDDALSTTRVLAKRFQYCEISWRPGLQMNGAIIERKWCLMFQPYKFLISCQDY